MRCFPLSVPTFPHFAKFKLHKSGKTLVMLFALAPFGSPGKYLLGPHATMSFLAV